MRHMSKMFGQSRELWHLCRAYISLASHYLANREWAQPLVRDQVNRLIDNYQATIDLRGGTQKVPLRQALKNVMTEYPTCLRDRYPDDVQAIITTVETLLPDFEFPKQKILGMMEVIRHFAHFLQEHKKNNGFDFKPYVMNVDEYDHYLSSKTDTEATIARILWRDSDRDKGEYRGLKLQAAVDRALNDKRFGPELLKAFTGQPTDPTKFQIALPEPSGDHFGPERFGEWTNEGMPKRQCIFCGEQFQDNAHQTANAKRLQHLKRHCGKHFYNGHLAVLETVKQKGRDADTVKIFKEVKLRLFKKYGERAGFLHTQRCRVRMLEMIEKIKATTGEIVLPDANAGRGTWVPR